MDEYIAELDAQIDGHEQGGGADQGFFILVSQKFRSPPKLSNFVKFSQNFANFFFEIST
jgi:hypothetical protein